MLSPQTAYDIEIPPGVSLESIQEAARRAVYMMIGQGRAHIKLAPGDATMYEIIITAPGPLFETVWISPEDEIFGGPGYNTKMHVTLANSFGASYPWNGESWIHPGYAEEKWTNAATRGQHEWTGKIIALFLNAYMEVANANA